MSGLCSPREGNHLQPSNLRRFAVKSVAVVLLAGAAACVLFAVRTPPSTSGLSAIHVPPGFKVELAAGPDLSSYPMMGTFDDRGRLFIAESSGNTLNGSCPSNSAEPCIGPRIS